MVGCWLLFVDPIHTRESIVKLYSCVHETQIAALYRPRNREEEELYNAYQLINRRSNSCGRSYQRVVNHVKPVCLCVFAYACVDVFA